ncbi:hypothetical protein K8W59_09000 [Nocardioides rotundus]|uniref:hypothetical protein n=1 Tax=Nocardioides rotundus TaxID=1774216 RepID=UPI001CBE9CB3|nr:hypothetical protein [Nocardioides rotundus]UAL31550.1 hypothetical protein K8W59_09000 [Nocardioides rotundus]
MTETTDQALTDDADWSIDDLLDEFRPAETVARFVLRHDLAAARGDIAAELGTLLTPFGTPRPGREDDVRRLAARLVDVDQQLEQSRRAIRFRGLNAADLEQFERKHHPDHQPDAEGRTFLLQLAAETAIAPPLTVADLQKLQNALPAAAISEIFDKARAASYGVDDATRLPAAVLRLAAGSEPDEEQESANSDE